MVGVANGVDMIKIDRLTRLDPAIRQRFVTRVFTAAEIEACAGKDYSLAGRFAVKEAAAKALGCGIGSVGWKDIETLSDDQSRPTLLLHNTARERAMQAGWFSWSVSISHTAEYAIALVTALFEQV
jgi:holo-[acyl-carrier protein] synthase